MSADLALVEAKWRLGLTTASNLHELASSLLDEGVESEPLIELFALAPEQAVWQGPGLLEEALLELRGMKLTDARAATIVARDLANRMLDGTLSPSEGLAEAASIHVRTEYAFDVFHRLYVLEDEAASLDHGRSYLGRTETDIAEEARAEARRIASDAG